MMDSLCFDLKQPLYETFVQRQSSSIPRQSISSPDDNTPPPPYTLPDETLECIRNGLILAGNEEKAETVWKEHIFNYGISKVVNFSGNFFHQKL